MAVTVLSYGLGRLDAAFSSKKKAIEYVKSLGYIAERVENECCSAWYKSSEDLKNDLCFDYYKVIRLEIE